MHARKPFETETRNRIDSRFILIFFRLKDLILTRKWQFHKILRCSSRHLHKPCSMDHISSFNRTNEFIIICFMYNKQYKTTSSTKLYPKLPVHFYMTSKERQYLVVPPSNGDTGLVIIFPKPLYSIPPGKVLYHIYIFF